MSDEVKSDAPLEWAATELSLPAVGASGPVDPSASGHTVLGPMPSEVFAGDPFPKGHTVLGGPLPEGFTDAPTIDRGLTEMGAPTPEALAPHAASGWRRGEGASSDSPYWPVPALSPAPHVEAALARAKQLHAEGVRQGKAGQLAAADGMLRESLHLRRMYLPAGDVHVEHGCVSLGTLYFFGGRPDLAEPLYREALAHARRRLGDHHPDTATRAVDVARLLVPLARPHEAYGLLRGAHDVFAAALGPAHPSTAEVLSMLRHLSSG